MIIISSKVPRLNGPFAISVNTQKQMHVACRRHTHDKTISLDKTTNDDDDDDDAVVGRYSKLTSTRPECREIPVL